MSNGEVPGQAPQNGHGDSSGLSDETYTAQRLQHASPEHLHKTSRRFFIGPTPVGWLDSHRKSWYKARIGSRNYSSRAATFSAENSTVHQRQLTGTSGPSGAVVHKQSFPQPDDALEDVDDADETEEDNEVVEAREIEPVDTTQATPIAEGSPSARPGPRPVPNRSENRSTLDSDVRSPSTVTGAQSYFTARESFNDGSFSGPSTIRTKDGSRAQRESSSVGAVVTPSQLPPLDPSPEASSTPSPSEGLSAIGEANSVSSLLPHQTPQARPPLSTHDSKALQTRDPSEQMEDDNSEQRPPFRILTQRPTGPVRFNLEDNAAHKKQRLRLRMTRTNKSIRAKRPRRRNIHSGQIVRAEKMLVRIDTTKQTLPEDYSENDSLKTEGRTIEKWREYLVVCRHSDQENTPFTLHLYKTRVVKEVQDPHIRKGSSHDIPLDSKSTKVNLYSSLDKTVVLWYPYQQGTRIYLMRPRSAAHSVEWYTFVREALGWRRPTSLSVHVPDLNITLLLKKPFEKLEGTLRNSEEGENGDSTLAKAVAEEQAVASRIIKNCMRMLEDRPEWASVLNSWSKFEKMGLVWKRYDRLEWVYGSHEQRMYGTIAMLASHDLELRPKQHYPTTTCDTDGNDIEEPLPIEGFLIRLTSQKGVQRRLGKAFFKRLYFSTHDQYLCFCQPSKASPPPPPRLLTISGSNIPSSREIHKETPLTFDIDPFPVRDGKISWLSTRNKEYIKEHDEDAFAETQRNASNLTRSEGYIDLSRIIDVRAVTGETTVVDRNDTAEDQDVSRPQDTQGNDSEPSEDHTFELVLDNNLTVKLQAYNTRTRDEWVNRLSKLMVYWKARAAADMVVLKSIRQRNLDRLGIDEELESIMGQFAQKWEVSRAEASPQLYHMCGISNCRTIKMSGHLYRKPRLHSTFTRCSVILTDGRLLVFESSLRKTTGEIIPSTHHQLQTILDLRDCYVYSGLLTESDLLFQNRAFDSDHPGRHALPRIYRSDGWTSADEDTATCFVIWHGLRKSYFRSPEAEKGKRGRYRQVSTLGVPGRSIVFKTRSRAERDRWVLSTEAEIDRLQQGEDLRVVSKG
ncbi:hypothetical protein FQN54_006830 [Arachnomyces sp. PD_36]|nr:hypothetical protein FQN54_006830 [Arachnomyces sp. PD_36]